MNDRRDYRIRELGQIKIALRSDVVFSPDSTRDAVEYLVEDPLNSKFYRLGLAEYTFVSLLDGQTTISEALRICASALPQHTFTERQAASLCRWLIETNLAQTDESASAARLAKAAQEAEDTSRWQRVNPLVLRKPLLRPDKMLQSMLPSLGWLYAPWGRAMWLLLMLAAAYQLVVGWDRFSAASLGIFAPHNWLWLAACWLLLKVWHELGHALVCKKYGGSVREIGVMFIMLAPIAYVDVTSSWRFRSKWQRIFTSAGGMYNELLVAALAAIVWSLTGEGPLNALCYNVVIMASLTTILINANPLMRFDGYYILADALEIPNLYASGQQYLRYWAQRYLLGVSKPLPLWSTRRAVWIRLYSVAALAWRVLVCVSLVIAASTLFHGAGIALAAIAVVAWLAMPLARFARYVAAGTPTEQPNRLRFALTTTSAAAVATIVLLLPWPGARRAPAVVEYAPLVVVRADSAGFIGNVSVEPGQHVERGDALATLENESLANELADIELAIEQSELKARVHQRSGKLAAYQAETETRQSLMTQHAEKRAQVEALVVRAPSAGVVIARGLESRRGTYVEQGDEIVSLGNERRKEIQLSVSQDDIDLFSVAVGETLTAWLPGRGTMQGHLARVAPRAALQVPHAALCARFGGPLPAKRNSDANEASHKSAAYDFVEPRFEGSLALDPDQSNRCRAGQLGYVSIDDNDSVGGHIYRVLSQWVGDKLKRHIIDQMSSTQ